MSQYDNTNRGALFKNDKEKESQPDFRGPINIDGKDYQLSAWSKSSDKTGKYLSLAIQPAKPKEVAATNSDEAPF